MDFSIIVVANRLTSQKLLVILGTTMCGKSYFSLIFASMSPNSEIINTDKMQLLARLDITLPHKLE